MQDPTVADPAAQVLYKLLADLAPGVVPYAILGWVIIKLRDIVIAAEKLPSLVERLGKIEGTLRELAAETKSVFGRLHTEVVNIEGRVARLEGRPHKPAESHTSWLLMGSDPLNLKGEPK